MELLKILEKIEQVTRIYNSLYEERADLYKKLTKRRIPFFRPKPKNEIVVQRLLTINSRERKIAGILVGNKESILSYASLADKYPEIKKSLSMMNSYFDNLLEKQIGFLDMERQVLNGQKSWNEALPRFDNYFKAISEFEAVAKQCNRRVFSPKELAEFLMKNKAIIPPKLTSTISEITVFVLVFMGIDTVFKSLPEGNIFDPSKYPSVPELSKFIALGSIISLLNIPSRLVNAARNRKAAILSSLALLIRMKQNS